VRIDIKSDILNELALRSIKEKFQVIKQGKRLRSESSNAIPLNLPVGVLEEGNSV
jgi:hypothetical protein